MLEVSDYDGPFFHTLISTYVNIQLYFAMYCNYAIS